MRCYIAVCSLWYIMCLHVYWTSYDGSVPWLGRLLWMQYDRDLICLLNWGFLFSDSAFEYSSILWTFVNKGCVSFLTLYSFLFFIQNFVFCHSFELLYTTSMLYLFFYLPCFTSQLSARIKTSFREPHLVGQIWSSICYLEIV